MNKMLAVLALLALPLCSASVHAEAVGDGFTYQGRLQDNGTPANGLYDLSFTVHDVATGIGTIVLDPVQFEDVPVEDGVFSVTLDFGGGLFDGQRRWLQISVRDGASSGAYETLAGRQELTPAPYALYALSGNPGPAGPTGATGPQGPSGVVSIATFAGPIGPIAFGGGNAPWAWAGTPATLTVEAGQRITGAAVGVFGHASTSKVPVAFSLCIGPSAPGSLPADAFYVSTYPDADVAPGFQNTLSAAGSMTATSSGTFKVGFCIKNQSSSVVLGNNDYVNGWFMVSN